MITLETINNGIKELTVKNDGEPTKFKSERARKRAEERMQLLFMCKRYLETNPREDFIHQQLRDVNFKLQWIEDNFSLWKESQTKLPKDPESSWKNKNGYNYLHDQLKALTFLING